MGEPKESKQGSKCTNASLQLHQCFVHKEYGIIITTKTLTTIPTNPKRGGGISKRIIICGLCQAAVIYQDCKGSEKAHSVPSTKALSLELSLVAMK